MKKLYPVILSTLFFFTALGLYSRHLDFPFFYHPDEPYKVIQILQNSRNFHHPLLMLNTAGLICWLAGSPQDMQRTVELGRWASVVFASAAVALLTFAAWMLAGPIAQITCGLILMSDPTLFEFAHYLKEDPALLAALAGVIVSLLLYERQPRVVFAVLAGTAGGLCISAKYIGILYAALTFFAFFAIARQNKENTRHLMYVAVALICTILLINWQGLLEIGNFRSGLGSEIEQFETCKRQLPNTKMLNLFVDRVGGWGFIAFFSWAASPWFRKRRLSIGEWTILFMTLLYGVMLLFSTRASGRYILPVTACMALVIPVGWSWLGDGIAKRLHSSEKWLGGFFCLLAGVGIFTSQIFPMITMVQGFQYDSRLNTARYLQDHLPSDSVIAEDSRVLLPDSSKRNRTLQEWELPFRRIVSKRPALWQEFTFGELRSQGVTHVVLTEQKELRTSIKNSGFSQEKSLNTRAALFFEELSSNAKLIYSQERAMPPYLHPGLRVYELQPAK